MYQLRPQPKLTAYYLALSIGGAIGGLFVALLAPILFSQYFEFHIALFLCLLMVFSVNLLGKQPFARTKQQSGVVFLAMATLIGLGGFLLNHVYQVTHGDSIVNRNFYGVLRVEERGNENPTEAIQVLKQSVLWTDDFSNLFSLLKSKS